VDTTGAGDQYAAVSSSDGPKGRALDVCGRLGPWPPPRVISHYGPRPQVSMQDLAIGAGLRNEDIGEPHSPRKNWRRRPRDQGDRIHVRIDLDDGETKVSTGDRVLRPYAGKLRPARRISTCRSKTQGDLHIDMHHTVEDTGHRPGPGGQGSLRRFQGHPPLRTAYIPMDETLTRCAIDCPTALPDLEGGISRGPRSADMDTELFRNSIRRSPMNAGALRAPGNPVRRQTPTNIAESGFKALARALRQAVELGSKTHGLPPLPGRALRYGNGSRWC